MSDIIDKTKYSRENMEKLFERNKLALEEKNKAAEEKKKAQDINDCQTLRNALNQFINTDVYSELQKNNNYSRISSAPYFHLHGIHKFLDIKSKCGVDFDSISKELSYITQTKLTLNLYKRYNWGTECYLEITRDI